MKKKGGNGNKPNKAKPKKHATAGKAGKHGSSLKSSRKQETRKAVVVSEKKSDNAKPGTNNKKQAAKTSSMADEFRNFDERMSGKKRQPTRKNAPTIAVAAPTFTMPAATFQLGAPAPQVPPPQEGSFKGFLTSIDESERLKQSQPQAVAPRKTNNVHPQYNGQNVFSVLDEEEEEEKAKAAVAAMPSFLQPATFTFQTAPSTFTFAAANAATDIDPDL